MNIRCVLASSVLVGMIGMSASSFARSNHNFWLINETNETIVAAGLSVPGDPEWHSLIGDKIRPGGRDYVTFDNDDPDMPCQVQLKVEFSNGESPAWTRGFNVCTISYIRVYWDSSVQNFQAAYK